jgi:tetratricopeptide (TPR) repeat protein/V8-like Glu-specific endopeptidase
MSRDFSRFLTGTATIAAIVIYHPAAIAAKSPQQIAQVANLVTVQVNTSIPGHGSGSGVIVAKQGDTYTVLTCDHVEKDVGASPTIRTYDGKSYQVTNVQSLGSSENENDTDLALLTFVSQSQYQPATLGNSDQETVGSQIYVFGYPVQGTAQERKIGANRDSEFSPGYITSRRSGAEYGYGLRYNALTLGGMSGGPVFDVDGRVIGIHGLGDQDLGKGVTESGQNVEVNVKTGFNSAIPINTFLAMRSHIGSSAPKIAVNNTASTDNPAKRLTNPESASDFLAVGLVQGEQGNKSGAINSYTQALSRNSNYADAYYHRGNVRYDQGENQGALEDYTKALSLNPKYVDAYFNRGIIRYNQGDRQGALEDFSQAISFNPNLVEAYYNRGVIHRSLRDGPKTLEDFDQVVRLNPKNAIAYYNRAIARSMLLDTEGTVKDFSEAIRLDPKFVNAYIERAQVRRRQGDKSGAIEDLTKAMSIDANNPNNAVAQYTRGLCRRDLGDRQGALEDLQSAAASFGQQKQTANYKKAMDAIERLSRERADAPR